MISFVLSACGAAVSAAAMSYALIAWRAAARHPAAAPRMGQAPAVSVLKPLCGAEPHLYECLRSFCEQRYRQFQIVCGVRDPHDPAIEVVRRLQRERPEQDLQLAISSGEHGSNQKVANLIGLLPLARHDYLVIADSDVRVAPEYLAALIPPLEDPRTGIATCLYRAIPGPGRWSALGCGFVNDWFMPSVRVAAAFGSRAFAFGATIALRRDTLESIGGFASIADQLADDYRLGELTRQRGLATVLAAPMVETYMVERRLKDLLLHELRWLRTIRAVQPLGYACALPSFGWPVAALGCALAGAGAGTPAMLTVTVLARLMLHFEVRDARAAWAQLWLLIPNDLLVFFLWCWGFMSRRVRWRETRYRVARDGSAEPLR